MTAHHAAYADADLGRAITASAERRRWLDELGTGEYPLPRAALDRLPQAALADIFHAQRKLLAELERLRQELRRSAPIPADNPMSDAYWLQAQDARIEELEAELERLRADADRCPAVFASGVQCSLPRAHKGRHREL